MRPRGFLRRGGRHALFAFASLALVLAVSGALSDNAGRAASGGQRFLGGPGAAAGRADSPSRVPSLPAGFHDNVAFSGLSFPTAVRFAPDGRVFVAEKSGLVKVFDSLGDTTPTVVADLRTEVDDYWDRGLLGLALDPTFPTIPFVYLLYTLRRAARADRAASGTTPAPRRRARPPTAASSAASSSASDGSPATSLTSRQVLIREWCQQYPSHSIGDLALRARRHALCERRRRRELHLHRLRTERGSPGSPTPANPCGDPPAGVGGAETPPTAEGGALRSQSPRRTGDPALLNGSILRVDPATGDAPADNPGLERRQQAADHRLRVAQPVPLRLPAGNERALDRRRRLERRGRRSTGGSSPTGPRPELRLAVLRGPVGQLRILERGDESLRQPLRGGRRRTGRTSGTTTRTRSWPATAARRLTARLSAPSRSTRARAIRRRTTGL